MISVVKRDGEVVDFNLAKISDAISKAFTATQKNYNDEIISLLSLRVTSDFQEKIKGGSRRKGEHCFEKGNAGGRRRAAFFSGNPGALRDLKAAVTAAGKRIK